MELPEHWKAVAITAGFRDVLLCGRNESHESLAICREIKSRFVNEINEPRDTQSNWLYTIVGEHENYLILSIKIPEACPEPPVDTLRTIVWRMIGNPVRSCN